MAINPPFSVPSNLHDGRHSGMYPYLRILKIIVTYQTRFFIQITTKTLSKLMIIKNQILKQEMVQEMIISIATFLITAMI